VSGKASETSGEQAPSLEARLRRLEEIVGQLETEELELDRALALFEEGVAHVREAESTLAAAELRVEELLGEGEAGETRPLDEEEA
jgi:exodeoxyribonuclease VII small subunit